MHKLLKPKTTTNQSNFYRSLFRNILLASFPILAVSALFLSLPHSSASSGTDSLAITISSACTLSSKVDSEHIANVNAGTYTADIGRTTITTLCNDGNGYSIYAIGYSNNEEGNNRLINSSYPQYSIDTGIATSGLTSTWGMKLNNLNNDSSPTPPVIETDYSNTYGIVPPYWTKVAGRSSGTTDMSEGSSFTTTYAVYAASSQYVGTYEGKVKYLLTHPSTTDNQLFMQDTIAIKNNLPSEGDSMQVIDKRDGKKYWVTRLADGNVWMTQNLDFDIDANTTLNSQTTDLNVAYNASTNNYHEYQDGYTESSGVIYWSPADTATTIDFQNNGPITGWQDSNTAPYSASKTDDLATGHSSLGNYYNWTAAIASNDSSTLTQDASNDISQNPQNSICPKGWRLPTISNQTADAPGSTNEFARLNYLYNGNKINTAAGLIATPLWFVLGANHSDVNKIGMDANYWSSTNNSNNYVYYLNFGPSSVVTNAYSSSLGKSFGFSIRCVAR